MYVVLFLFKNVLLVPNLPSPHSLANQHIQPVFNGCATLFGFLQEQRCLRIVNQVETEVVRADSRVGNIGAGIGFGRHTQRCAVDYKFMVLN